MSAHQPTLHRYSVLQTLPHGALPVPHGHTAFAQQLPSYRQTGVQRQAQVYETDIATVTVLACVTGRRKFCKPKTPLMLRLLLGDKVIQAHTYTHMQRLLVRRSEVGHSGPGCACHSAAPQGTMCITTHILVEWMGAEGRFCLACVLYLLQANLVSYRADQLMGLKDEYHK